MDLSVYKKFLGFNNSSNEKKFTEEFIAAKKLQFNNFLSQKIPKHAPAANGTYVSFDNPKQNILNLVSHEPKNFTNNDRNCPIGFANYVTGSPYAANFKVFHLGRYWISNVFILSTEEPAISPKWVNITEYALTLPLRKRQNLLLKPLNIEEPDNYSFCHQGYNFNNYTPLNSATPLMFNNRTDCIQINVNEFYNLREILPGDNILILSTPPMKVKAIKVDWEIAKPDATVFVTRLSENDPLYVAGEVNEGLNTLITGTEMFRLYEKNANYLENCIDFAQDNFKTYTPQLIKNNGDIIPFGLGDYFIDNDVGIITFHEFLPPDVSSLLPIRINCYQYIGSQKSNFNIKLDNIKIHAGMVGLGGIKMAIGNFELDDRNSDQLIFDFSAIFQSGLQIDLEFYSFDTDETIKNFTIANTDIINKKISQILVIDKPIYSKFIEIRAIKDSDRFIESMNMVLLSL